MLHRRDFRRQIPGRPKHRLGFWNVFLNQRQHGRDEVWDFTLHVKVEKPVAEADVAPRERGLPGLLRGRLPGREACGGLPTRRYGPATFRRNCSKNGSSVGSMIPRCFIAESVSKAFRHQSSASPVSDFSAIIANLQ